MAKRTPKQQDMQSELDESTRSLLHAEADLIAHLHRCGNEIAKKHKYRGLEGLEAVRYFLMQKHNWTPAQVRSLNYDDLRFAMSQDARDVL